VARGDANDLDHLRTAAESADAIIHTAFNHDFTNVKQSSEDNRKVIKALGDVLKGSARPLVVTSGTGLVRPMHNGIAHESDPPATSAQVPRAATEEAAVALIERGLQVVLVRLPQVHNTQKFGRISIHIGLARKNGWVAYIGDGANRVPAAHVSDVATLFRLSVEQSQAETHFHAVAEQGIPAREIAEAIGRSLQMPVKSVQVESREAREYFGPITNLAALDLAASGEFTKQKLGWVPHGPTLIDDLSRLE
jgi:nucleoside-diphosphate-sugar epimerase